MAYYFRNKYINLKDYKVIFHIYVFYDFLSADDITSDSIGVVQLRPNNPFKPIRTKLDEMVSAEAKGLLTSGGSILGQITDKEESLSDDSLSSGDGTRFKNRTGIFDLDFPPTQKISKGQSKVSTSKIRTSQIPRVSREIPESDTDSDIDIRQSGVVANKNNSEAISTDDDNGLPSKETVPRSGQDQTGFHYVMLKVY